MPTLFLQFLIGAIKQSRHNLFVKGTNIKYGIIQVGLICWTNCMRF